MVLLLLEYVQIVATADRTNTGRTVMLLRQTVRTGRESFAQRLIQLRGRRSGQRATARLLRYATRFEHTLSGAQFGTVRLRAARHFVGPRHGRDEGSRSWSCRRAGDAHEHAGARGIGRHFGCHTVDGRIARRRCRTGCAICRTFHVAETLRSR